MRDNRFLSVLTRLGEYSAHPAAFAVVFVYAAAWLCFDAASFNWHAIATLATWLMTLFITRTEHRDTQAVHAKLDELLRAQDHARNALTGIDDKDLEAVVSHRQRARQHDRES